MFTCRYFHTVPRHNALWLARMLLICLNICSAIFITSATSTIDQNNSTIIDLAQAAIDSAENDIIRMDLLMTICAKNRWKPETESIVELSLKIANESDQDELRGKAHHIAGLFYFYNDNIIAAERELIQAMTFENPPLIQAKILSVLGGVYGKQGNYPLAIDRQLQAKGIFENELRDSDDNTPDEVYRAHAILLNSMANISQRIDAFEQAGAYYEEAQQIFLTLEDKLSAAVVLGNKGEMLNDTRRFEEALLDLEQAAKLKEDIGASPRSKALTTHNLAYALVGLGKFDEAIPLFENAIEVFGDSDHKSGLAYSNTELGRVFHQMSQFQSAYDYCKKGNQNALSASDLEYQEKSFECLYEAAKALGLSAEALAMHEQYLIRKDSNMNESNVRRITQLEMQYEFDQQQQSREIALQLQQRKNRSVVLTLALFIAGLLLISYLIYRGLQQKKREQIILAEKNAIISSALSEKNILIKEIHHRVKNNLQVISSLLSLQSRHVEDPQAVRLLKESRNRVMAMAMIHQNLYETDDLKAIDLKPYIEQLVRKLFSSYNVEPDRINLNLQVDELRLEVDTVISMGLIINELITNSLKHAFQDGRSGTISVTLFERDAMLHLKVADDGVGVVDHAQALHSSFGYEIVRALNSKLKADMEIDGDSGLAVTLHIRNYTKVA